MNPENKKIIKAKKPAAKTVTPSKAASPKISPISKLQVRVQTAEGWKREMMRERKAKKSKP